MVETTTPSLPSSEEFDSDVHELENLRINVDEQMIGERIPPQNQPSGPIKVDIKPGDPNEIPYEVIPNRVFVGGFPLNTTEDEVRKIFGQWGEILEIKIIRKEVAGQTKGYGFVTYKNDDHAEEVRAKESVKINGKRLNLGPAMRRLYPTLKEVKEQKTREREQIMMSSDGADSPSTTNDGTPPATNGRRIHSNSSNNNNYGYKKSYRKNRTYNSTHESSGYYAVPKPVPLLSLDMTPMYIAPFDLNKAIHKAANENCEFPFLQCTVPMNDHALPAAIRQQFLDSRYAQHPY